MYYSVMLSADAQSEVFAINAVNTKLNFVAFSQTMQTVTKYAAFCREWQSRRKCLQHYKTVHLMHSLEEMINTLYEFRFYRYEKTYDTILAEKVYEYDFSKWRVCCGDTFFGGQEINGGTSLRHLFFNVYMDDCPFLLDKDKVAKILGEAFGLQVCVAKGTGDWLYIRSVNTHSYIQSVYGVWELHLFTETKVESGEIKVEI